MAFDLRVTHRDKKDGSISKKTPYRMHVSKDHGVIFERDGKKYREDGTALGAAKGPVAREKEDQK